MKLRIGVDLDGVLYDFGNSFRDYMCLIDRPFEWEPEQVENTVWNFYENIAGGMTYEEFRKICDDGVDAGVIFSGAVRPNAVEAIRTIAALGHEIIIITDRQFGSNPNLSHYATLNWLAEHDIPFNQIVFSADKTVVETDMFVEDKLENYDALIAKGVDCYLINRPWNLVPGDSRQRIDDIIEYAWAVEAVTKSTVMCYN